MFLFFGGGNFRTFFFFFESRCFFEEAEGTWDRGFGNVVYIVEYFIGVNFKDGFVLGFVVDGGGWCRRVYESVIIARGF